MPQVMVVVNGGPVSFTLMDKAIQSGCPVVVCNLPASKYQRLAVSAKIDRMYIICIYIYIYIHNLEVQDQNKVAGL